MENMPVSVCLVTYNRAEVLPETIESILRQTFPHFELIISDDCSPDHTEEVCRKYAEQDKRIRYFRNKTNLSMPGNLNEAIRHSRGQYIANLHDGDIFREDLLEKWKAALDKHPSAGFVANHYEFLDEHGRETGRTSRYYGSELVTGKAFLADMLLKTASPLHGTVMARRSAYETVGEFDPRFGIISDVDMWMRLAAKYDLAVVPEPLIFLRPRERTHPWNDVTWTVFYPFSEEIIATNIMRNFGPPNNGNLYIWSQFYENLSLRVLRQTAADVRHGRFSNLRDALQYYKKSRCLALPGILRLLIRLLSQWAGLNPGRHR
jgi:glycosyltransferase involved in cell wall biosynthesis